MRWPARWRALDFGSTDMNATASLPDAEYRYRYDGLQALRGLLTDFCARRWDNGPNPWPHKSLCRALQDKPNGHGIYRICFWVNEGVARKRMARGGGSDVQILMRVRTLALTRVFEGWTFEEDDHLPGEADLIWSTEAVSVADEDFRRGGVPLEDFEVWTEDGGWRPWHFAEPMWPEPVRMARIGWGRVAYRGPQHTVGGCYWQILPDPRVGHAHQFWCLLTSDEVIGGSVVGDLSALSGVLEQVVDGAAGAYAGAICGVLVVDLLNVPLPEVWTQQYAVQWTLVHRSTCDHWPWGTRFLVRRLVGSRNMLVPDVEPSVLLKSGDVRNLIVRSGLRLAKIVPREAWLSHLR
ncbi:hypothetical protein SAMN05444746_112156 [Variovorax sp. OK212]|nr:hypothetical protein SAMN05518853_11226 [Variovorax sp. OK202]SFD87976.1 hypothetical protein SAMN05444746_112156 [Variovorax sp. OK212]